MFVGAYLELHYGIYICTVPATNESVMPSQGCLSDCLVRMHEGYSSCLACVFVTTFSCFSVYLHLQLMILMGFFGKHSVRKLCIA